EVRRVARGYRQVIIKISSLMTTTWDGEGNVLALRIGAPRQEEMAWSSGGKRGDCDLK
ncbi:hypothetical protein ACLOJK_041442, partial [Asimina triloba]